MKRFSMIAVMLIGSFECCGMQMSLKGRLQGLATALEALEIIFMPRQVLDQAIPAQPGTEDPLLKQFMAHFFANLTEEQRADFLRLSDQEKRNRLIAVIQQPRTVAPEPPSPLSSPSPEPEPLGHEIPAPPPAPAILPGASGVLPPPPPPAPGLPPFVGGKTKPAAPAPLLPVLTAAELAQKTEEEKKRSDGVFLEALRDLASTEYIDNKRFKETVRKVFKDMRNKEQFLKRAELDALMNEQTGLFALLAKDFTVGKDNQAARLAELYETFTKVRTAVLLETIIVPLSACLFDQKQLAPHTVELLVVSSIVSERDASQAQASDAAQQSSDKAFLALWDQFAQSKSQTFVAENALTVLARSLNFLRLNPAFVLYGDMLWKGIDGTTQRGVQKAKKIYPLLIMLMSPRDFITQASTGAVEIKRNAARHLFDLTLFEKEISTDSLKAALQWQLVNTKPVITMSLADFLFDKLQKVTSLTQLQTALKSVANIYQGQMGAQEAIVQGLQKEFTQSNLDVAKIMSGFAQLVPNLSQDRLQAVKELVESDARDKQIIGFVQEARKVPGQFKERLLAASQVMPSLHAQLEQVFSALYRTPRDVYMVINRAVQNKKMLTDNTINVDLFYATVMPYGILLRIFDYFAIRYEMVKDDPQKVKLNLDMLMTSLEAVATPRRYFDPKGASASTVKSMRSTAASSIEAQRALLDLAIAPVLLDINTNQQLMGTAKAGYYSEQLTASRPVKDGTPKVGIYDGLGIEQLLNLVKDRSALGIINFLKTFVGKAQGVDITSPAFIELLQRTQDALEKSFSLK